MTSLLWTYLNGSCLQYLTSIDIRYLFTTVLLSILLLSVRNILERFCFKPVGTYLGIKSHGSKKLLRIPSLEKVFLKRKGDGDIRQLDSVGLAKQLDWSDRQVDRWFRLRHSVDKSSALVKFCETCWRLLYYASTTVGGVVVLWDKSWLWDIDQCYNDYPHAEVTSGIWWHNVITVANYLALLCSQFYDVRRKDFWQMFVHHIVSIVGVVYSLQIGIHRFFIIIVLTHDSADVFLEAAKMFKYAKCQKACDITFPVFAIVWVVTRCYFYPFVILPAVFKKYQLAYTLFPSVYYLRSLFFVLMALNFYWTYLIFKIIYKTHICKSVGTHDSRSSSSEDISEES